MTAATGASRPAVRRLVPRDAGTLIVVEKASAGPPRILFGRRRADLRFAPGKVVFPGGRVDPADRRIVIEDTLRPSELEMLLFAMKGRPSEGRARAIALAAVRETYEETGLVIGTPAENASPGASQAPPAWDAFLTRGYRPRISGLRLLARAITPPGRPRRFDARFFVVPADEVAARLAPTEAEFDRLEWATIEEARLLDLHGMTRAVLDDLADRLDSRGRVREARAIPFYFQEHARFRRVLIPNRTKD